MTTILLTIAHILTGVLFVLYVGRKNNEYFDFKEQSLCYVFWPLFLFAILIDRLDVMNRRGD